MDVIKFARNFLEVAANFELMMSRSVYVAAYAPRLSCSDSQIGHQPSNCLYSTTIVVIWCFPQSFVWICCVSSGHELEVNLSFMDLLNFGALIQLSSNRLLKIVANSGGGLFHLWC